LILLVDYILNIFSGVEILHFDGSHIDKKLLIAFVVTVRGPEYTLRIIVTILIREHKRVQLDLSMQVTPRRSIDFR